MYQLYLYTSKLYIRNIIVMNVYRCEYFVSWSSLHMCLAFAWNEMQYAVYIIQE